MYAAGPPVGGGRSPPHPSTHKQGGGATTAATMTPRMFSQPKRAPVPEGPNMDNPIQGNPSL